MLKISAVLLTTSVFAGLLITGPTIVTTATVAAVQTPTVKVKTFVVRAKADLTKVASFELPGDKAERTRYLRRPAIAGRARVLRRA